MPNLSMIRRDRLNAFQATFYYPLMSHECPIEGKVLNGNIKKMAEGVGFEPTVRLHVQRFSRPPRSTAPASLLRIQANGG